MRWVALLWFLGFGMGGASEPDLSGEVLVQLFTQEVQEAWFSEDFLAQVPVGQVEAILAQLGAQLGAFQGVRPVEPGRYLVVFEKGYVPARIGLDARGRIASLFFEPPVVRLPSLKAAQEAFRALPGQVGLWVEKNGQEVLALNPESPLAVASAFKLMVLALVLEEVEASRWRWDQVVRLQESWKSLPSGILQNWPAQSPLTLHTLAALMISLSDNTAADALMHLLGRERLEAHAPQNRPFLTTREAFQLAAGANQDLLQAYREGGLEVRRQVLERLRERPLPRVGDLPLDPARWPQEADWHFAPRELCAWMGRVADLLLLGINPGLTLSGWDSIAFKGGSRPGVLSLVHALKRGDDRYCVAFVWNNPQGVETLQALTLYGGLLDLLP